MTLLRTFASLAALTLGLLGPQAPAHASEKRCLETDKACIERLETSFQACAEFSPASLLEDFNTAGITTNGKPVYAAYIGRLHTRLGTDLTTNPTTVYANCQGYMVLLYSNGIYSPPMVTVFSHYANGRTKFRPIDLQ